MADYYLNSDALCDNNSVDYGQRGVEGIEYFLGDIAEEPVTVDEFKQHAKIDFSTDDTIISTYLVASRQTVERILQKSLGVRTVTVFAQFMPKRYRLVWGNYASVSTSGFTLLGKNVIKEGGTDIEIVLTTEDTVMNTDIKNAILKQAFDYYEKRGVYSSESAIDEVMNILGPYRNITFP